MSLDNETLLAYVDGELSPQMRIETEKAIEANAEMAQSVRAMFASRLPYQSAFAQEKLPPVPPYLEQRVAELTAVAQASHDLALAGHDSSGHRTARRGPSMAWMLLVLFLGLMIGYTAALQRRGAEALGVAPWIQRAASYHSMYNRETVLDGSGGQVQFAALKERLLQQHGLNLNVPDFSREKLQFVRAQQLHFNGKMVLQLVYLPQQGMPVALCLTPNAGQGESAATVEGQQAVAWHQQGWAYVLLGQVPQSTLMTLRQEVRAPVV